MPYSSNTSLPVSTNECTASLSIAELPVNAAAPALVVATSTLPISAAQTADFEPSSPPSGSASAMSRAQQLARPRHDVVDAEAELLEQRLGRRGGAEVVDADDVAGVADIALPAQRRAGLDGQAPGHRRRQHRVAVGRRLRVEQVPA